MYVIFASGLKKIWFYTPYIEQIADQNNAQRNKSLRLKIELRGIKTLDAQCTPGINHEQCT